MMDLREEACALIDAAVPVAYVDENEPDEYLVPASFVHRLSAAIAEWQRKEDMAVAAWERANEPWVEAAIKHDQIRSEMEVAPW